MVKAVALGDRVRELLGRDRACFEQYALGRDAGRAGVLDRLLGPLAVGEAELDDHVGQEPTRAAAPPRRGDAVVAPARGLDGIDRAQMRRGLHQRPRAAARISSIGAGLEVNCSNASAP